MKFQTDRDAEIRRLVPFIMRATKCKRDVAIELLCRCNAEEKALLLRLHLLEMLNKKPKKRPAASLMDHPIVRDHLHSMAWSKPR